MRPNGGGSINSIATVKRLTWCCCCAALGVLVACTGTEQGEREAAPPATPAATVVSPSVAAPSTSPTNVGGCNRRGVRARVGHRCQLRSSLGPRTPRRPRARRHVRPAVTADYRFENSLADSVGAAAELSAIGADATGFIDEAVFGQTRPVLTFDRGSGLALTPASAVVGSEYTHRAGVPLRSPRWLGEDRRLQRRHGGLRPVQPGRTDGFLSDRHRLGRGARSRLVRPRRAHQGRHRHRRRLCQRGEAAVLPRHGRHRRDRRQRHPSAVQRRHRHTGRGLRRSGVPDPAVRRAAHRQRGRRARRRVAHRPAHPRRRRSVAARGGRSGPLQRRRAGHQTRRGAVQRRRRTGRPRPRDPEHAADPLPHRVDEQDDHRRRHPPTRRGRQDRAHRTCRRLPHRLPQRRTSPPPSPSITC